MTERKFKFVVVCDNKASFQISLQDAEYHRDLIGKPVALVRCDRLDPEDNERGHKLAEKIAAFLNTTPQDEIVAMVADESLPPLR